MILELSCRPTSYGDSDLPLCRRTRRESLKKVEGQIIEAVFSINNFKDRAPDSNLEHLTLSAKLFFFKRSSKFCVP